MKDIEIKVPVPWGHIAVKAWGNPANEAIVAIHGLIDNAGTYDALIPLLPRNFYYLCIDLPGHGFSSHFPSGLPVFFLHFIYAIKYVTEYFEREKYVLLGHSFGGRLAVHFAQLYPRTVSKIAILDSGYASVNDAEDHLQSLTDAHQLLKKTESFTNDKTPSYSYHDCVTKVMESRFAGSLTFETAKQLANRMIKKVSDDKYEFTYDRRLRTIVYPNYTKEYIRGVFKKYPVRCPAISIYSANTGKHLGRKKSFLQVPNFEWVEIEGHHHSHHTDPEVFAPILTKFLLNQKHKL
ncbi:hypothetical protein Trydic_g22410 [Trypoxylus dichotomus]